MRWSASTIADAVADGLRKRAAEDDLEQAVYGFDHLDELGLHPVIHRALREAGFGVWPEQKYPGDYSRRKRSEGKRCDVVLTPGSFSPGNSSPEDSATGIAGLREPLVKGTLFDTPDLIDPEAAYWLEIKTVAQFESTGPFPRYTSELLSPVAADVKKLWADGSIYHAGLLLVLFTMDQQVGEHDLGVWHSKCLERGYPVGIPATRSLRITDRIGNGCCHVAVFPVRGE